MSEKGYEPDIEQRRFNVAEVPLPDICRLLPGGAAFPPPEISDIAQKPPKKAAHNPALHDRSVTSLLWLLVGVPLADRTEKHLMEAAVGRHLGDALPELRRQGGAR